MSKSDILTKAQMRNYLMRLHGLATGNYAQDDTEMKKRIAKLCEEAVEGDAIMKGFLGRGGRYNHTDTLNKAK